MSMSSPADFTFDMDALGHDPDGAHLGGPDDPRTEPCPECPTGEVVTHGIHGSPTERYTCSAGCGWEG